ncbi:hypothetical protein FRB94_005809 [Tulasnella sp. JGI-2019a]|nr:hypothetical protein FRB94_005809 [Tulasnella sp. JGI-2019a]
MTTKLPSYDTLKSGQASGAGDVLPGYDGAGVGDHVKLSTLDRNLPPTFRINKSYLPPLVQPSELQAHLVLLRAFHRLCEQVKTQKGPRDVKLSPDETWAVFLERAVYRFQCWGTRMIGDEGEDEGTEDNLQKARLLSPDEYPPIDVMMVWYTYMLSPRTYHEDCLRVHNGLQQIGSFPLLQFCSTIDPETLLPRLPTESRSTAFMSSTGESFEPPLFTALEDKITGYAQRGFSAQCDSDEGCRTVFDRETLGVRKFYEDMEKCVKDSGKHFLANILVDYKTGVPAPELSKLLTGIVLRLDFGHGPALQRPEDYGTQYGWKLDNVETLLRDGFFGQRNKPYNITPKPLNLIMAPYRHVGPFSMDLASAILRQMSFIDKMVNLGWTEEGRFEEDHDTLTRCVVRYHAFLDLVTSTPASGNLVVPTLSIVSLPSFNLIKRSTHCSRKLYDVMGIVPDHDDKVTQGAISAAYDQTAEAWKARFSIPYSVCGCPPPIMGSSGGSITSLFSRKERGKAGLVTVSNPRPDLVSADEVYANATHPSDHNSVALINPREENVARAQPRRQELGRRCKELGRAAGDWSGVISKRAVDHSYAFLSPVSYGAKEPFSNYG